MADEQEEGWYTDPYGRHEARWMSAGSPTKLVRDSGVESYDHPPDEEPSRVATMIVEATPGHRRPPQGRRGRNRAPANRWRARRRRGVRGGLDLASAPPRSAQAPVASPAAPTEAARLIQPARARVAFCAGRGRSSIGKRGHPPIAGKAPSPTP